MALLALSGLAFAQSDRDLDAQISAARKKVPGTLKLRMTTAHAAVRSDAPFSVEFELDSTFLEILDGDLDLTFLDDQRPAIHLRTLAIAVPTGRKNFRLLLPSMAAVRDPAAFLVHVRFETPKRSFDLGWQDLLVPIAAARNFVMAAVGLSEAGVSGLARRLSLDAYRPKSERSFSRRPELLTLPVELDPHEIPGEPVGYSPFDVLILTESHFSTIAPRQLDTIREWIGSGGGAVIIPTGSLAPSHTQFLARLAGRDAEAAPVTADPLGRLTPGRLGDREGIVACRYGFGRALILTEMPAFRPDGSVTGIDQSLWTKALCFLWNVRPEQTHAIGKAGVWERPTKPKALEPRGIRANLPDDDEPFQPRIFPEADALRAMLFPADVQVVPFSVVATILTLFLLAIAPGDYLVLGWLRRRRYTWVVLPALCLVFTVTTVQVAARYTGSIDHRTALVIVDLGEGEKPSRTTRIEHVITAANRRVATEMQNGLFTITSVQPATVDQPDRTAAIKRAGGFNGVAESQTEERLARDPLEFHGSFPARFTVERLSRQWTPAMHRVTRSGAESAVPLLPWGALDAIDAGTFAGREKIVGMIRQHLPNSCLLFVDGSHAAQSWSLDRDLGSQFREWPKVLEALSRWVDPGLFSLVSAVSPNGAGNLEDLAVADAGQPGTCVLHVAVREGSDLVVFRRVLRKSHRVELK